MFRSVVVIESFTAGCLATWSGRQIPWAVTPCKVVHFCFLDFDFVWIKPMRHNALYPADLSYGPQQASCGCLPVIPVFMLW